ncbi:MAG TPA: HD-GYP domain-containing protein [Bacilli bacterium]
MRLISTDKCVPGMKLGKSIYNNEGLILLGVKVELNQSLITRLIKIGIDHIYIEDSRTDDIIIPDLITDQTRVRAITEIRSSFRKTMDLSNHKKTGLGNYHLGKTFSNVMSLIIDDLSQNQDAMIMVMNMNAVDHYLYNHSLSVCIYATMLGISQGYSKDELMALGIGALLHDIGKTQIPMEILFKSGKLTDEEFTEMKKHAELGYKILKDEPNISLLTAHCAYQHHERVNGSGYPRGIKGKEIHDYAKWIGLVDSYDAMTTHRVYRAAMLPHQALEVLYTGSDTLYDMAMIEKFRDNVAVYPPGVMVTLHTGAKGVVVSVKTNFPQRPVVRILENEAGERLSVPYEVDLSQELTAMITSVNDIAVE